MSDSKTFQPGGYRFVPGPFQYSGGVAAEPGHAIVRVRFAEPVPLVKGFAAIERIIGAAGRPLTSFCACELRSPAPFTEEGFVAFNKVYVGTLQRWGIFDGTTNPVARSNVCPALSPPPEPSFHAFSFTVTSADKQPSFVVAGSGEAPEGHGSYKERIIRLGETSPDAIADKARYVLGEMERRMKVLGFSWQHITGVQLYCVHDVHHILESEIARRGAMRHGLTWQYCRPPVVGLEYEMDCRAVADERVVAA